MAEKPKTYPKISRKYWWLLRDRFRKSMPSAVTPTFVASVSEMTNDSARANVIAPLRDLGLIEQDGKPTPLANQWRNDDDYKSVCDKIRSAVYPEDLVEAYPTPSDEDKQRIKSWFMRVGHVGDAAASRYTDTYLLLSEGDPTKRGDPTAKPKKSSTSTSPSVAKKPKPPKPVTPAEQPAKHEPAHTPQVNKQEAPVHGTKSFPIHIDVQVHISPDTSPEQIDTIFSSMAKHLSKFI